MATPVDLIPQWVKDARAWTSATKMNQAGQTFADANQPVEVQNIARQIAGLYEGMRYGSEDAVDQYDARTAAARAAMMDQFAKGDATTNAAYANSQNYTSEIAKRLGLEGVLQGPGFESQRQQQNQVLALNNANRTNQMASYDMLRGGYGNIMRDRLGSFDVQAGTSLANLLTQLQAQAAAAAAAKGGGGGGGGGGRGRGSSGGDTPTLPEVPTDAQVSYMAVNPTSVSTSRAYSIAHPNDTYYTSGEKANPSRVNKPDYLNTTIKNGVGYFNAGYPSTKAQSATKTKTTAAKPKPKPKPQPAGRGIRGRGWVAKK